MVIHSTPDVAVREQELLLATIVIRPVPPAALKFALGGESEKEHCWASAGSARHTIGKMNRTRSPETLQTRAKLRSCGAVAPKRLSLRH